MRVFHNGHFQINSDCIVTDQFYTLANGDKDGVNFSIHEGNNSYDVSVSLDIMAAEKFVKQLSDAIIEAKGLSDGNIL